MSENRGKYTGETERLTEKAGQQLNNGLAALNRVIKLGPVYDRHNGADKAAFDLWWHHEGSKPPLETEDHEEHTRRTAEIAWLNGAYVARELMRSNVP